MIVRQPLGSRGSTFRPAGLVPRGSYRFDVGGAGSVTALSPALPPVLATADEPVRVDLTGGLFRDGAAVTDRVRTAPWLADLFGAASSRLVERLLTIDPAR